MAKTKKLKISIHKNFRLIAVSGSLNDYNLVWHLTKILNVNFIKAENLEFVVPNNILKYNIYKSDNENISIICNKDENDIPLIKIKNVDYFLKITNANFNYKDLIKDIRNIDNVTTVFIVDIDSQVKSIQNSIFNLIADV